MINTKRFWRMMAIIIVLSLFGTAAFAWPGKFRDTKLIITEDEIQTALLAHKFLLQEQKDYLANNPDMSEEEKESLLEEISYFNYDSVVEDLFKHKVQVAEGEYLGLEGSADEAAQYVITTERMYSNTLANGSDEEKANAEEVMDRVRRFNEAAGISDEEYRNNQIRSFKDAQTIANLKEYFFESEENRGKSTDELETLYDIYVIELMSMYQYEVVG